VKGILRLLTCCLVTAAAVGGCAKPASHESLSNPRYGFTVVYPGRWQVNSDPSGVPPPEGTLLTTRGAKITVTVSARPNEGEMPKNLRDQGWLETKLSVDGVGALAYSRPGPLTFGIVRRVMFPRDGLWYDISLTVSGRRYLPGGLRAFEAVVASWKWATKPSDTGLDKAQAIGHRPCRLRPS
jgi:hypothetical protein